MRYIGLDYGSKHIGLSLGDDETNVASPLEIIANEGLEVTAGYLKELFQDEQVDMLVVGVPQMGSAFGDQRTEILEFVYALSDLLSITIEVFDESFTSKEAQERLKGTGEKHDHAVAAMLILQSYFDSQSK